MLNVENWKRHSSICELSLPLKGKLAALRLEDEEKASKCQELESMRAELQMVVSALEEEQKVLHNLDHLQ